MCHFSLGDRRSFTEKVVFKIICCARFGSTYTRIGTIQRRLAWPLSKDDMQIREAFHIFKRKTRNYKTQFLYLLDRVEKYGGVIIELYQTVNGTFCSATSHELIKEIPLGTNREFSLNYAEKCSLSKYNSELCI